MVWGAFRISEIADSHRKEEIFLESQEVQRKHSDLVSIIMPTYNCREYIRYSLESVIAQTYQNWELIIVDDGSTDDTAGIIKEYMAQDSRVKYTRIKENSGAAIARNTAVDMAQGRYLAFLDSDDLWMPSKLTMQINFMKQNDYSFTCTSYKKIDEQGKFLNRVVRAKPKLDYNGVLKACPGNSTVIYDSHCLGKYKIPNIRKRNDYVMWLQIIKKADSLYGLDEVLTSHRIRSGSISSNKASLIKYQWKVYCEIEKLPVLKAVSLIVYMIVKKILNLDNHTVTESDLLKECKDAHGTEKIEGKI